MPIAEFPEPMGDPELTTLMDQKMVDGLEGEPVDHPANEVLHQAGLGEDGFGEPAEAPELEHNEPAAIPEVPKEDLGWPWIPGPESSEIPGQEFSGPESADPLDHEPHSPDSEPFSPDKIEPGTPSEPFDLSGFETEGPEGARDHNYPEFMGPGGTPLMQYAAFALPQMGSGGDDYAPPESETPPGFDAGDPNESDPPPLAHTPNEPLFADPSAGPSFDATPQYEEPPPPMIAPSQNEDLFARTGWTVGPPRIAGTFWYG